MAERRVPRIRFKGFEEDWEQRKLGELAFITTGKLDANAAKKDGEYNFFTCGKEILKTNSYAFDGEAILINGNGDLGYTRKYVGKFNAYQRTYVLQGFVMDYEYIEHAIHKFLPDKIKNESIGGAMPYIKIDSLMNLELPIPVVQEAVAVTRFLNELDSLLSLHQRKLEKLKILKKAMLEKMFPKNGAKVPEIRFSGFTDDWEQRKLGELADIVGGGTPSTSNLQYWDGDIDWYAPAEINEQVYISSSQKKITKAGYENSSVKLLPVGTVLFTSRAGIGKTAILDREACTNQGFQSIVPHKQELDSYFIFSRSAELKQYGEIVGAGSTFVEVSGKQMSEMELMMPLALNEQQAIGTYFRRLDQLLSLHQRKLEKLRQIKKSMLERMFV